MNIDTTSPLLDTFTVTVQWNATTSTAYSSGTSTTKLVSLSDVTHTLREDGLAVIDNLSFSVHDFDGVILALANSEKLADCSVTVDRTIGTETERVFTGRLNDNVSWDEGTRVVQLSADSTANLDADIGIILKAGDVSEIRTDAIGRMVPMPFGCPHKFETLQLTGDVKGTTQTLINEASTSVKISGGNLFTQTTPITVLINDIGFTGAFTNETFAISASNVVLYTNVTFAERPDTPQGRSPDHAWVTGGASQNFKNKFFYMEEFGTGRKAINRCVWQAGEHLIFQRPWYWDDTPGDRILVDDDYTVAEVCGLPHVDWEIDFIVDIVTRNSDRWATVTYKYDAWEIPPGAPVTYLSNGSKYAVSSRAATLLGVYAKLDGALVPVPSSYYTYTTATIQDETVHILDLSYSLLERNEGWDSTIYCSVNAGTEYPDGVVEWLIGEYSSYTVSKATGVSTLMADRRCNFCLHDSKNVLLVCAEIAHQAMLSLTVKATTVNLKPRRRTSLVPEFTLDSSSVVMKTASLTYPTVTQVLTKVGGVWRPSEDVDARLLFYERNADVYGERRGDLNFYIFDVEPLVQQSLYFTGYRLTDAWRGLHANLVLSALGVEAFDVVDAELTGLLTTAHGEVRDIVQQDMVNVNVELAVPVGTDTEDPLYWLGDDSIMYTGYTGAFPYEDATITDYVIYPADGSNSGGSTSYSDKNTSDEKVLILPVKNNTLQPLNYTNNVVKLDGHIVGQAPTSSSVGIGNGIVPVAGEPFALLPACGVGNIVDAVVYGTAIVRVDMTNVNHKYATCITGDPTKLVSAETGEALILWRAEGTGTVWAVVRLGSVGGGSSTVPPKFLFTLQIRPNSGSLIPDVGEYEVGALGLTEPHACWLRIQAVDAETEEPILSYLPTTNVKLGFTCPPCSIEITPEYTGKLKHALQTQYESDYADWITGGQVGPPPTPPNANTAHTGDSTWLQGQWAGVVYCTAEPFPWSTGDLPFSGGIFYAEEIEGQLAFGWQCAKWGYLNSCGAVNGSVTTVIPGGNRKVYSFSYLPDMVRLYGTVDDMVVVSPDVAQVSGKHITVANGFVLRATSGYMDGDCNDWSITIGANTASGGYSSPDEFAAICRAAGLKVVDPRSGFLTKAELITLGFPEEDILMYQTFQVCLSGGNSTSVACYTGPQRIKWTATKDCGSLEWVITSAELTSDALQDWTVGASGLSWVKVTEGEGEPLPPDEPVDCYFGWFAYYDCYTASWTIELQWVYTTGTYRDWTDYGGYWFCVTNSPTEPAPPDIDTTCYYHWYLEYWCTSASSGEFQTPYLMDVNLTGPAAGWTPDYSDPCYFTWIAVTTTDTPPANPTAPDCSGCA